MTDDQQVQAAVEHLKAAVHIEDRRTFWQRLLASLRLKISGTPPNEVEITGGTDF
jgi:hypothetical protein